MGLSDTANDGSGGVLVCQRGARHRYAIPRLFEEAGLLSALYTDSSSCSLAGKVSGLLGRCGVRSPRVQALASRVPLGIPRAKVCSSDRLLLPGTGRDERDLSDVFVRWGLRGARVVYSMYGEEFGFIEWAKAHGAKLVVDVFVHPATLRIVEEESLRATGRPTKDAAIIEPLDGHSRTTFELADILLCPSGWVADGVRDFAPDCAGKIRVAPYGSSLRIRSSITESPRPGRVFFAGRDPVRKGLRYLAEAAREVGRRGVALDVRVAGVSAGEIEWMEYAGELDCLGAIPLDEMHEEFNRADVFVFPSLSEGQAGVVLEAMACGCPVIATRESGVDFDPECGVVVPARDSRALADALHDVVVDRNRRRSLAEGALRQARQFSMEAWKNRLVAVAAEAAMPR